MPDPSQSTALLKHRTAFPPAVREIETLELRQRRQDVADSIDIVFVVDVTDGMQPAIDLLYASLAGMNSAIAAEFPSRNFGLVTFRDEGDTVAVLGASALADFATVTAAIGALVASGGGDTPDNGFGALVKASGLAFRDESARAVVLVTNSASHSRGATFLSVKFKLLQKQCYLFSGIGHTDPGGYDALTFATSGALFDGETSAELSASLASGLLAIANPVAAPVYIVNDNQPLTAFIEDGSEVEFLTRSFKINPFLSGEDGSPTISLTVDNADLAVSRFLANAKKFAIPLEVTLRVYLSNDLTTPQNIPPIRLFAKDFSISGGVVSCQLRWLDLANSPFPNSYYTATRCPSLQQ